MLGPISTLSYNLYADSSRRLILGDGSRGTSRLLPAPGNGSRFVYPMFGVIPPGQRVPAGHYSDTIQVEVEF